MVCAYTSLEATALLLVGLLCHEVVALKDIDDSLKVLPLPNPTPTLTSALLIPLTLPTDSAHIHPPHHFTLTLLRNCTLEG